jgi:hypothetical protein
MEQEAGANCIMCSVMVVFKQADTEEDHEKSL